MNLRLARKPNAFRTGLVVRNRYPQRPHGGIAIRQHDPSSGARSLRQQMVARGRGAVATTTPGACFEIIRTLMIVE